MKKKNYPLQLLTCITYRDEVKSVEKIFDKFDIAEHCVLMGKGTAASKLGDLFGFGVIDRDVTCAIVDSQKCKDIIFELDQKFNFNNTHSGICFCVPVDAISSDLFAFLNLNREVNND